jgi:hypothetical protein
MFAYGTFKWAHTAVSYTVEGDGRKVSQNILPLQYKRSIVHSS